MFSVLDKGRDFSKRDSTFKGSMMLMVSFKKKRKRNFKHLVQMTQILITKL